MTLDENKNKIFGILDNIFNGYELNKVGHYKFFIRDRYVVLLHNNFIRYSQSLVEIIANDFPSLMWTSIETFISSWMKIKTGFTTYFQPMLLPDDAVDQMIVFQKNQLLLISIIKRLLEKADVYAYKGERLFIRNDDIIVTMDQNKEAYINTTMNKLYNHIGIDVDYPIVISLYRQFIVDVIVSFVDAKDGFMTAKLYFDHPSKENMRYISKGADFIKNNV